MRSRSPWSLYLITTKQPFTPEVSLKSPNFPKFKSARGRKPRNPKKWEGFKPRTSLL